MYDLLVDGDLVAQASTTGGKVLLLDMATGSAQPLPGPVATVRFEGLPDRVKDVEIRLPHTEITELVARRTDAPVAAVPPGDRRVWLHHAARSATAPTRRARPRPGPPWPDRSEGWIW